jgi:hypothetical protein
MKIMRPPSEAERVAVWLLTREAADKELGRVPPEAQYVTGSRRKRAIILMRQRSNMRR